MAASYDVGVVMAAYSGVDYVVEIGEEWRDGYDDYVS